jgi:hypothetical protein
MRAAGLALACVVVGGGVAFGYLAADRDYFAGLQALDFFNRDQGVSEPKAYPLANRDGKVDRIAPLRTDREEFEPAQSVLPRGDSLRQSYAAVDPTMPKVEPVAAPPIPKPRPKAHLLRRLQSSYTLLSDLQIEAIKTRLKLTPEQERGWPAVETALRGVATRLHAMKTSGAAPTDLAPDSAELVQLKAAATPFFAQLNADQKRELKMLAHLIGLGKVVAQL